MAIAVDTYPAPERRPGDFARHPGTGAPYVSHPTETKARAGKKADLIAECARRGIEVPEKATVAVLRDLLGPEPKRVAYGRPSSLGKQIENMTNLQKWSERAVALGLFLTPELWEALQDLDPAQLILDDADARKLLDEIAVKAKAAAQAGIAAERGTHTHELTEDLDLERDPVERMKAGEELGIPAAAQLALVEAWEKMLMLHGFEVLAVEASVVDDVWRQAGTLDRIVRLTRDIRFITATGEFVTIEAGTVLVLDVKTGRLRLDQQGFVSYWHGYAVQCASYAQATPYDVETDTRGEWGFEIDQRWAIIAHLDVLTAITEGKARCRLVLVDLAAGREAGERCVWARQWEKRTDVFSIPTDDLMVEVEVEQIAADEPAEVALPSASSAAPSAPEVLPPSVEPVAPATPAALAPTSAAGEGAATLMCKAVGVTFQRGYPDNLFRLMELLVEDRGSVTVQLRRNPANEYDANAIEVHVPALLDHAFIGHLSRPVAEMLAPDLDADERSWSAEIIEVLPNSNDPSKPGVRIRVTNTPTAPAEGAATVDDECIHGLGMASACTVCNGRDAVEAQRPDVRIFPAKYASQCEACDLPISLGAMIAWAEGMRPMHELCWERDQGLDDADSEESDPGVWPDNHAGRSLAQATRPFGWSDADRKALAAAWPAGLPAPGKIRRGEAAWTAEQLEQARQIIDSIDPFNISIPPAPPEPPATPPPPPRDEPASDFAVDAVMFDISSAGASVRAQMNGWLSEAKLAGRPWHPRIVRTARSIAITRAAHHLAVMFAGDDDAEDYARAVLAVALRTDAAEHPATPIGAALAELTIDEADLVGAICTAIAEGDPLTLQFSDDGHPVIVGDPAALIAA